MGGGIRGQRQSYAARTNEGPTLDRYMNQEPSKRVFISFHMEDEAQVQLLRQQAKDERYNIEFIDYSIKEPFDERWKTQAT
jgi:DNA-dependent RNA polymerase auxiliary subunit epsilon